MTTSRTAMLTSAWGEIPVAIDTRGQVTAEDIDRVLNWLGDFADEANQSIATIDVLMTVRHDRDAGAQARVRVEAGFPPETGEAPIEVEVYAGAMRNAIDEADLRFEEWLEQHS